MQEKVKPVLAGFNGVQNLGHIADPIRTIACRVAPTHDGGAWDTPPSEDFSRAATMWASPSPTTTSWIRDWAGDHHGSPMRGARAPPPRRVAGGASIRA